MNIVVKDIDKMVFVATLPRSGSSMDCGILEICGAFGGDTMGCVPANPKGIFENQGINQMILRPILKEIGINSSRGLLTLSKCGGPPSELFANFKEGLTYGMQRQGYKGGVAYFKNGLYTFFFDKINEQFPDAIWLLPSCSDEKVILSNKNLHPNRPVDVVTSEIADYRKMYKHIKEVCGERAHIIDNDEIMSGNFSQIRGIITSVEGLEWDEDKVKEWVDPDLWAEVGMEKKTGDSEDKPRRRNGR